MDVVSLGTVAADDVEILVNGTHTLSVGKDVLLRSSVLGGLRLPLQSSASIDVEKGYIQCYCGHVQQCSGKLSNLPDATESLILLLKVFLLCMLAVAARIGFRADQNVHLPRLVGTGLLLAVPCILHFRSSCRQQTLWGMKEWSVPLLESSANGC